MHTHILKTKENDVLQAYSQGRITWREAADSLGIDGFASFRSALGEAGLTLYESPNKQSEVKMAALYALLEKGL